MKNSVSRRKFLAASTAVAAVATSKGMTKPSSSPRPRSFRFCLNTSTIMGAKLGIEKEIDIAARAGYDGIEPWIRDLDAFREAGGKLTDLAKRIEDHGLAVESAIGFAAWIVDDAEQRAKGLETLKRDMDTVQQIGGSRIAAPPAGASKGDAIELPVIAERYRQILEIGREMGVRPMVEVWGSSKNLNHISQTLFVAAAADHPDASLLLDVYHLHRGGSGFAALSLLGSGGMEVMHVNDYPAGIPLEDLVDADRVMPGDGTAPFDAIITQLRAINPSLALSLELFNRDIWKMPPLEAAKLGLEKLKAVTAISTG